MLKASNHNNVFVRITKKVTFHRFLLYYLPSPANKNTLATVEHHLSHCFALARNGDDAAYKALLEGIAGLVRRYARRRLVGQDADVEDLVQDVLLAVHLKQDTYDSTAPVTAWVHTITRYKMIDFWRQQSRRAEDPLTPEASDALVDPSTDPRTDRGDETEGDLPSLMARLSARQREVITMVKLNGYSVQETAKFLGLSESVIKVSTHRGLKKMTELLRRDRCKQPH